MGLDNNSKSLDIFGIKPIADSTDKLVTTTLKGVESFLASVCKPALEEFGLLAADHVRKWRLNNIIKIIDKSKDKLEFNDEKLNLKIHPAVALGILENGSLTDDKNLQNLWSGLFSSSCSESEINDENIIFVSILKSITSSQARIIEFSCKNSNKNIYDNCLLVSEKLEIDSVKLKDLLNFTDLFKLDRELEHLKSLGLFESNIFSNNGGINLKTGVANITPSALMLNLYVKCQGFNKDPQFFWKENIFHKKIADIKPIQLLSTK